MPLLAVHMSVIQEVVDRIDMPELRRNLGAALLGCTAPDRRVLTRQPREETHFFDLGRDGMGDGPRGLRLAHPEVARDPAELDWPTRALVIGYLSHLAADETWIVEVYRPFFADGGYLGSDPARNILDRALQYDLERQVLATGDLVDFWRNELGDGPPVTIPAGFLSPETLRDWHAFVQTAVLSRDGGWHEFPRFIARFRDDPGLDDREIEAFMEAPEMMFERVFAKVPKDVLANHRESAINASIEMARPYLS
ncbi:MAG: zinc dependent phospholipase C family protein [Chloroflexi bacterium]|nr:zinc dependent phospholipase C family protein [Chloroflexota bacterium]